MATIMINEVLRADGEGLCGFYRVVAIPAGMTTMWLAFIGPWSEDAAQPETPGRKRAIGSLTRVAKATLQVMAGDGRLAAVDVRPIGKLLLSPEDLSHKEREIWEQRRQLMAPFLNHELIAEALARTSSIGPVVRAALRLGVGTRGTVYRLWSLLCVHGFDTTSLYPRFDRCGAPDVLRPHVAGRKKVGPKCLPERLGEIVPNPQRPTTEDDRTKILLHAQILSKPGLPFVAMYDQIVQRVFVTRYEQTDTGRRGVLPEQGTFPNRRQVRHIIESGTKRLDRVLRKTTQGHFERNLRGLHGKAYDGVAGPGHAYAIDATIGDIHLRSSINRAWPIGRPIVYMVVDIWSTAIVGFYVCLSGPSWAAAKVALFATCCDPRLIAELWGFKNIEVLTPAPTAPFQLWTDRGEYVSVGARDTGLSLGFNVAIDPAYRPDMKGLVEVLHRIAKDQQFHFLPGAINARRRELELRPSAKESALTLREYVQYLNLVFCHYNLHADRSHRLTMEMIGAGVQASPAGLWRFGHEVGIGYRKSISQDRLITGLLPRGSMVARRDGIFHESLQYEAEIAKSQQWTAHARNFGTIEHTAFHFPGSASRLWWPDPRGSMHEFSLCVNARAAPEACFDEWRDSLMFDRCKRDDREYRRLQASLQNLEAQALLRKQAIERTAEADAAYEGLRPHTREARRLETISKAGALPAVENALVAPPVTAAQSDAGYDALMDELFSSINRES